VKGNVLTDGVCTADFIEDARLAAVKKGKSVATPVEGLPVFYRGQDQFFFCGGT